MPDDVMEDLLDITFDRYFSSASLMGTHSSCKKMVWQLKAIGVDEIACLIDFIDDYDAIIRGLHYLDELRASCSAEGTISAINKDIDTFTEGLENSVSADSEMNYTSISRTRRS